MRRSDGRCCSCSSEEEPILLQGKEMFKGGKAKSVEHLDEESEHHCIAAAAHAALIQ